MAHNFKTPIHTMTTQKVDMLLEGRSHVSRYQPFASSLYIRLVIKYIMSKLLTYTIR